jgi:hypothetical protein
MFVKPVYFENEATVYASCYFLSISRVSPLQSLSQEQLKDYSLQKASLKKEEEDSSDDSDSDEDDDDDDDDDEEESSADSKDGPSEKQQVSEVV